MLCAGNRYASQIHKLGRIPNKICKINQRWSEVCLVSHTQKSKKANNLNILAQICTPNDHRIVIEYLFQHICDRHARLEWLLKATGKHRRPLRNGDS